MSEHDDPTVQKQAQPGTEPMSAASGAPLNDAQRTQQARLTQLFRHVGKRPEERALAQLVLRYRGITPP